MWPVNNMSCSLGNARRTYTYFKGNVPPSVPSGTLVTRSKNVCVIGAQRLQNPTRVIAMAVSHASRPCSHMRALGSPASLRFCRLVSSLLGALIRGALHGCPDSWPADMLLDHKRHEHLCIRRLRHVQCLLLLWRKRSLGAHFTGAFLYQMLTLCPATTVKLKQSAFLDH